MRRKLLLMPVFAAGLVGLSQGQQPGGFPSSGGEGGGKRMGMFGGPGGGTPDPEMIWGFVSKGQPSINLNDPANSRTKDRMVKDGTPIPADGILTKEAFKANWQASMDKRAASGGQPGATAQFQAGGTPGGGFGGRSGPGGGFDPSAMTDEQLRGMMRDDTDKDGRISAAEAAASRSDAMRDGFAQYDTNRDGFVDTTEYRAYLTVRFQQRQQSQGQQPQPMPFQPQPGQPSPFQPQPGQPAPVPGQQQPGSDEPARPEVWRYGKLPKGAPSWFLAPTRSNSAGLDADHDGQVGLYEWRRAGRPTAEFVDKDQNGDGYLTYLEYETWVKRQTEKQKEEDPDAPAPMTIITPGGPPTSGDRGAKGDRGPKGDRTPKGERKGGNPFANRSKGS